MGDAWIILLQRENNSVVGNKLMKNYYILSHLPFSFCSVVKTLKNLIIIDAFYESQ